MKIFYPKTHLNDTNKRHLFPLLNTLEKKSSNELSSQYELIDNLHEAKIVFLPLPWNYYVKNGQEKKCLDLINEANKLRKRVYIHNAGDYGVKVPKDLDIIIFRACGYKSKSTSQEQIMPFFLTDPLPRFFNSEQLFKRAYNEKPTIGFCGQVNESKFNAIKEIGKVIAKNLLYYAGLKKELPQDIQSTSYNRSKILNLVERSNSLQSNFIRRKKYRAGATTKDERSKTTLEYYENIIASDYILCYRGAGNFSVRLYETLAMGRIPIFINTDCMLPLEDKIKWKDHVVWVEYNELHKLEELVFQHYSKFNETTLNEFFYQNRKMWLDNMGMVEFFKKALF